MANPNDPRESFPSTENASGVGVPLTSVVPGQATANVNGAVGFAFQDVNGNAVLPMLDGMGRVFVNTNQSGSVMRAKGTTSGVLMSATGGSYAPQVVVASIPLTNSATGRVLSSPQGKVACRRGALFQLYYQDTVNTVILDEAIVDSGEYTTSIGMQGDQFMVPASAASPILAIRAGNFNQVSDLHSAVTLVQY